VPNLSHFSSLTSLEILHDCFPLIRKELTKC
jgi:hypothetical protein